MVRVYEDISEALSEMKFVPVLIRGRLFTDIFRNGVKIGRIDKNNPITIPVQIARKKESDVRLVFDVRKGILIVNTGRDGEASYAIAATSGRDQYMNNPDFESNKNYGPIPRGVYEIHVSELEDKGLLTDIGRRAMADWGDWRVRLHRKDGKKPYDRTDFFLHGGDKPGSAGCIDIGGGIFGNKSTDRLFRDLFFDRDKVVPVIVQ